MLSLFHCGTRRTLQTTEGLLNWISAVSFLLFLVYCTLTHSGGLYACPSHLKPNSKIAATSESWISALETQEIRGKRVFQRGANPRPFQGPCRLLGIPTTFAAKGLMPAPSPGWTPAWIIAGRNINLSKLKTAHILKNSDALAFLHGFLLLPSLITASVCNFFVIRFQNSGQAEKI